MFCYIMLFCFTLFFDLIVKCFLFCHFFYFIILYFIVFLFISHYFILLFFYCHSKLISFVLFNLISFRIFANYLKESSWGNHLTLATHARVQRGVAPTPPPPVPKQPNHPPPPGEFQLENKFGIVANDIVLCLLS